jgi:hypothetical protein
MIEYVVKRSSHGDKFEQLDRDLASSEFFKNLYLFLQASVRLSKSLNAMVGSEVKDFSFCLLSRTEELLKQPKQLMLFQSFFPAPAFSRYRSPVDLLFCELFPTWKESCFLFYEARGGGRLHSFAEASPKQLLAWDIYLSETVLPRLKNLYLRGRRRWSSVLPELRLPQPPPLRRANSESLKALPTSLGVHKACSEALEIARLKGLLCRIIHELVEAARFNDEVWFEACLSRVKQFVESLASDKFGVQLATKVLIERIHYVETLPQYGAIRKDFSRMLKSSRTPFILRSPQRLMAAGIAENRL